MKGFNQVIVMGNLGKDPDVRQASGFIVAKFSVGCNRSWKDKNGERRETTDWIYCVAYGKVAEIVGKYLKKGSGVHVTGRLTTRSYDDQNGNKHYVTEIIVSDLCLLPSAKKPAQTAVASADVPAETVPAPVSENTMSMREDIDSDCLWPDSDLGSNDMDFPF